MRHWPGPGALRIALLLVLVACDPPAPDSIAEPTTPCQARAPLAANPGRIVFHSDPGGDSRLSLTNPDGSGVTLLTDTVSGHPFGAWSPDGEKLAFLSGSAGMGAVHVIRADGLDDRTLTDLQAAALAWSPDGTRLAFEANGGIYVVEVDGAEQVRVTNAGFGPKWSPDCRRIVFFSDVEGNPEIYTVESDGSDLRRLTQEPAQDVSPAWSPDGTRIAFVSSRDGNTELYVMDPDGGNQTRVTRDPAPDESFEWAPDGEGIVYVSYRGGADPTELGIGNAEVFLVHVEEGEAHKLSANPAWDGDPSWSPDGAHIVFTRRTDHAEIYVMRADGSGQRMLPGLPGEQVNDCCADWQPVTDSRD